VSSVFGTDLRTHRRRLGLSQEDLARRAHLDAKTVRSIEQGRTVPRPSTVRQLADTLGLAGADRERFYAAAAPDPPRTVPAQLPLDVHGFTGRKAHLDALDAIAAAAGRQPTAVVITAIDGTAGIGKTSIGNPCTSLTT
jgi:transcriptional regulator with XRE-family HTH domain